MLRVACDTVLAGWRGSKNVGHSIGEECRLHRGLQFVKTKTKSFRSGPKSPTLPKCRVKKVKVKKVKVKKVKVKKVKVKKVKVKQVKVKKVKVKKVKVKKVKQPGSWMTRFGFDFN
jgi:hypothetical protein